MREKITIIKKDGTFEGWNPQKIINATNRSAARIAKKWTPDEEERIISLVEQKIDESCETEFHINTIHSYVEYALEMVDPKVAKQYRNYRNWKEKGLKLFDEMENEENRIRYIGDRSNANKDAKLVATKRSLLYGEYSTKRYEQFFLTEEERQSAKDGYIYVHDKDSRLDTFNCFERCTRFITQYGVRSFYDFEEGDEITVLTQNGNWKRATVHRYGWQQIQKVTFVCDGVKKTIGCTKNHRWFLSDNSETTELKAGDVLKKSPDGSVWIVKEIDYDRHMPKEVVWCLDVPDDHGFVLDGNIPTGNCCLADVGTVLSGGFEMGNMWYNEPNSLDTAFDVLGDIVLATGAQQYGGFTVPEVDSILVPYAKKSYERYFEERFNEIHQSECAAVNLLRKMMPEKKNKIKQIENDAKAKARKEASSYAMKKVKRECEQGMQGIEYKLNTVSSSRGDYVFVTFTFGLETDPLGKMIAETILEVRKNGQGKKGFKKPVLFPKLVFLYDENLHGEGKENEDEFEKAVECSSSTMYPDYLSLTGEGYVPSMYQKYQKAISPMGCRAFLSPWFNRGGMHPADEQDEPVFVGRFNLGVVSLNLPMILAKSRAEEKPFYEILDYYMEMIRDLHKRTIEYLGGLRAACNPVMFCQGGAYLGNLRPDEKIASILKPCTVSFGITALNELQMLYNGKNIREDGSFALETMRHINELIDRYKEEDQILYAVYGTPAETLCGKQIEQFRRKYGVIKGVSDRIYNTNSFHDPVWLDILPVEKQDDENRFWNLFNGGKIQYCRYPIAYNKEAIKTLVRRAMKMGLYEGVNLSLSYCNSCGHQELDMDKCPVCGSKNITAINRMNGYLGFTRTGTVDGDKEFDSSPEKTGRFNVGKLQEIKDRKSM